MQRSTGRAAEFRRLGIVTLFVVLCVLPGGATSAISAPAPQADGTLLPTYRIVAYYGNPLAATLGRVGETSPDQMLARLRRTVDFYTQADPSRPVKPLSSTRHS